MTLPDAVITRMANRNYSGATGDYLDLGPRDGLEAVTLALSFAADRLPGTQALISMDAKHRGAGEFTLWLKDGILTAEVSDGERTTWLEVPDLVIEAGQTHHVALSMGDDGLMIWLDGALVAAEPEFKQDLSENNHDLLIGASRAWWDADSESAHSQFDGEIGDVKIFDQQLNAAQMRSLAAETDPSLSSGAQMDHMMEQLAPVFGQLHGASETFLEILEDYGVGHHGHMHHALAMQMGTGDGEKLTGSGEADGIDGGFGDDKVLGRGGDDVLQGNYGNDVLKGGAGHDVLDGGHGEDILIGGKGNDLLISRADGREGAITYDPNRDEGDPLGELTDGKLYPDQPLHADDLLVGGKGADIFYFQSLINAKARYIEEHTRDDGTINWHGVAGENDKLHDHWVDVIGYDVIRDFSRAEGDRIVIEGHTTEIASVSYGDRDGNGVLDHSIIQLYSEQGNGGGAHADDLLGKIAVYGDLITLADIEQDAGPAYGIVKTIDDLDEAVTPAMMGEDTGRPKPRKKDLPVLADLGLETDLNPVLAAPGTHSFDREDRAPMVFDHSDALGAEAVTVALKFEVDSLGETQVLFSKDARDHGQGGHVTAYIESSGTLVLRLQDTEDSYHLRAYNAIRTGTDYDLVVNFDGDGAAVYLNGAKVAEEPDVPMTWANNSEALVLGAGGWSNTPGTTDRLNSFFDGTIEDFAVYDQRLTSQDLFGSAPRADTLYFSGSIADYDIVDAGRGTVDVSDGSEVHTLDADTPFANFADVTVRLGDIQVGSVYAEYMNGDDGSDVLIGGLGADDLRGRDNSDFLRGGAGQDSLYGGRGSDTLEGGEDGDRLVGESGADQLFGGKGGDTLQGGDGNDDLYGGLGDDMLYGHHWNEAGSARNDRAFFDGEAHDFTIEVETRFENSRGENVTRLIVTDHAGGGADGYYEGRDVLIDIDTLVFADQSIQVADLL